MAEINPKVSIILPTYNGAKYIRISIDSCLNQTYKNIELIIVDDGSKDNSPQIIKGYRDQRIKYIRENIHSGIAGALNKGFSLSTGEYLTWTSDDNFYSPEAVGKMLNVLQSNKRIDFVYANYYKIDEKGDILTARVVDSPKGLSIGNCVGACFLYTRRVYQQIGDYKSILLVEDYEYWLRVREKFRMKKIRKYLYYYRVHPDSLTYRLNLRYEREETEKLVEKIRDEYVSPSVRRYLYARKKFYKKNYIQAKKLLKKCLWSNFFNIDAWRILTLLYLHPSITKAIRKAKWSIIDRNSDSR